MAGSADTAVEPAEAADDQNIPIGPAADTALDLAERTQGTAHAASAAAAMARHSHSMGADIHKIPLLLTVAGERGSPRTLALSTADVAEVAVGTAKRSTMGRTHMG